MPAQSSAMPTGNNCQFKISPIFWHLIVVHFHTGSICIAAAMADPVSVDVAQRPAVHIYSKEEITVLDELEVEAHRLFPPSLVNFYPNVTALKAAVNLWSNSKGAHISHRGYTFNCSRGAPPESYKKYRDDARNTKSIPVARYRSRKTKRCGCKFIIYFSPASKVAVRGGIDPKAVRITERSSYRHTNGCFPSQCQLIVDKKSSGAYQQDHSKEALSAIIAILRPGRRVPCAILRDMMRPLYPDAVALTAQNVFNMRLKVQHLLLNEVMSGV